MAKVPSAGWNREEWHWFLQPIERPEPALIARSAVPETECVWFPRFLPVQAVSIQRGDMIGFKAWMN